MLLLFRPLFFIIPYLLKSRIFWRGSLSLSQSFTTKKDPREISAGVEKEYGLKPFDYSLSEGALSAGAASAGASVAPVAVASADSAGASVSSPSS